MESIAKSAGSTAAIDLKNELLSVVEEESNPQPQPVQVAPLPIVLTASVELEEKCANQEIITPPLHLNELKKPCDTETFIQEKLQNITNLPAVVKKHENLAEHAIQKSVVSTTKSLV